MTEIAVVDPMFPHGSGGTLVPGRNVANGAAKPAANSPAQSRRGRKSNGSKRDQSGSHARRLVRNLQARRDVLERLFATGLEASTIAAVGLGLKESYSRADGETVSGVLVYPVSADGDRVRYGNLNLDGITTNPEHALGWTTGQSRAISIGTGEIAVVCASAIEAWLLWQSASAAGIDLTVLASTAPDVAPAEWRTAAYWSGWTRVVVTEAVPPLLLSTVAMAVSSPLERCRAAPLNDDGDGIRIDLDEWVRAIVDGIDGRQAGAPLHRDAELSGDYALDRVSIHGGLQQGRMLYAFPVERRERSAGSTGIVYSYRTLVLRSDGAVLEPQVLPAPPGTPIDRRVHALSDGTRIGAAPCLPSNATWSLRSIERFVSRMRSGAGYQGPTGISLHQALTGHLRSSIWLPNDAVHGQIASFVMATFFHRLFDAFPILYLQGPKGSGKSELTAALVASAFNGALMSQGSPAALVRLVRESGGLVAIDDAEILHSGFGELAQILKVGYKASTAIKRLVGTGGATETIDFFGPRILTNTRGLDHILASRCICVGMSPLPPGTDMRDDGLIDLASWRDQMHDFAMSHVVEMAAIVRSDRPAITSRADELRFPLDAVERLIGA